MKWPYLQVPDEEVRAHEHRGNHNAAAVLFTGNNQDIAQAIAGRLFPSKSPALELFEASETLGPLIQGPQGGMQTMMAMIREFDPESAINLESLGLGSVTPDMDEEKLIQAIRVLSSVPSDVLEALLSQPDVSGLILTCRGRFASSAIFPAVESPIPCHGIGVSACLVLCRRRIRCR